MATWGWSTRSSSRRSTGATGGTIGRSCTRAYASGPSVSDRIRDDAPKQSPLDALQGRTLKEVLGQQERQILAAALEACEGNKTRAARMLGLSWLGLSKKLQRFGIGTLAP